MKEAFGFPANVVPGPAQFGVPPGASSVAPLIPAAPSVAPLIPAAPSVAPIQAAPTGASAIPAIQVINDSDSDPDVQSLTIPFRSGSCSSENFLPMISTDDSWITEQDFRFVS